MTAVVSQTVMPIGDHPGHEIGVIRHLEFDNSSTADFDAIAYDVVETTDYTAGNGTHRGYRVSIVPGEDRLSSAYEGTTRAVTRPGAAPDITFEGKWWFTGGTGKFRGITGGGTYKGQAGPAGVTWEWQGDYEVTK